MLSVDVRWSMTSTTHIRWTTGSNNGEALGSLPDLAIEPRNGSGGSCSIAKYEAERFFHCSAVHQRGEFINGFKWLRYIVIARFRLFQLPFLG